MIQILGTQGLHSKHLYQWGNRDHSVSWVKPFYGSGGLCAWSSERLLYRLSTSAYADRFVLEGAMLLASWFTDPHRATRDIDLLGFGDPSPDALTPAFAEDEHKQRQWNAFLENVAFHAGSLADVIASVARFIMPHAIAAANIGRNR